MRFAIKYMKRTFFVLFFMFFIFMAKKAREIVFAIDGFSVNFDDKISCEQKRNIFNFINLNQDLKKDSLYKISEKIKSEFDFIKNVEVALLPNGVLAVNVFSVEPKILINQTHVLAQNFAILKSDIFTKYLVASCKPVTIKNNLEMVGEKNVLEKVSDKNLLKFSSEKSRLEIAGQSGELEMTGEKNGLEIGQDCKKMLLSINEKYFDQYDIVRESEFVSYLKDKNNNNFAILFNDYTGLDDQIINYCLNIKSELEQNGEFCKKKIKSWVTDIRFKDQVVLYVDKSGFDQKNINSNNGIFTDQKKFEKKNIGMSMSVLVARNFDRDCVDQKNINKKNINQDRGVGNG